jgi:hypothetical protein
LLQFYQTKQRLGFAFPSGDKWENFSANWEEIDGGEAGWAMGFVEAFIRGSRLGGSRTRRQYTIIQMGDSCEMLVGAELTLAGDPAARVSDSCQAMTSAQPAVGKPQRISVKARTHKPALPMSAVMSMTFSIGPRNDCEMPAPSHREWRWKGGA